MRVPTSSRRVAGLLAATLISVVIAHAGAQTRQREEPTGPFAAFRVDDHYVIAVVRVTSIPDSRQVQASSAGAVARYGFVHFDVPAGWEQRRPTNFVPGDRWTVHAGPGLALAASAERVVAGELGCEQAFGVLLRVEDQRDFTASAAKYFVAEHGAATIGTPVSSVGPLPRAAIAEHIRPRVERVLDDILRQGLRAQEQEEKVEARDAPPATREWLQTRRSIDAAIAAGRGKLTYDVQAFRLGPAPARQYFVRAKWMVGRDIGFAASVWLQDAGKGALVVVANNPNPPRYLRMREFGGEIVSEHQGLVLNVIDRDGDGWAEVLVAFGGYEAMHLSLRKFTGSGFEDLGIGYSLGC